MKFDLAKLRKDMGMNQIQFAKELGIGRTQLWDIERGAKELSKEEIISILRHFGVTGHKYTSEDEVKFVPLLPITVIGGADIEWNDVGVKEYECEKIVSQIKEAELAIRVSGDSMYPRYANGSIVFIKRVNPNVFIEWGSYYVLNTTNGNIVKRVMKKDDKNVECQSLNPSYAPFDVPMNEIRGWYKVLGCLHLE